MPGRRYLVALILRRESTRPASPAAKIANEAGSDTSVGSAVDSTLLKGK